MAERRFKDPDELSMDENVELVSANRRNHPRPKFERAEYREARAEALRAAGFDEEVEAEQQSEGAPSTVAGHLSKIRKRAADRP